MKDRDPEKNFEVFWKTFRDRYPFFELRGVDWQRQYDIYRPKVRAETSAGELFQILSEMIDPLDDGHVEVSGKVEGRKREFTAEKPPRFHREFPDGLIKKLFKVTDETLVNHGFSAPGKTQAWMLRYARSPTVGYMRILELEDIKMRRLKSALDDITRDFAGLQGFIIDIRDCPGGEDDVALAIINRFVDQRRVAFHRKTQIAPGEFSPLKTWHMEPEGKTQFTGPVVLLTTDSVFSGGEAFALAIRELPHVVILGDHTNGIFSYTLDKDLPNGWEYCLSYQVYYAADMTCYEGKGIPADIELLNSRSDIERGVDPLIVRALELTRERAPSA
jgi:hypothetical protein